MSIDDRLQQTFGRIGRVEPSDDLWSRVVHSIEEDRRHRRRVVGTAIAVLASVAVIVAVGAMSLESGPSGRFLDGTTLMALETTLLLVMMLTLGPAIRRFGRGYAGDLWPPASPTPGALLKLLDIAYLLVFSGYVLITTDLADVGAAAPDLVADQIQHAAWRLGGMLLLIGVLHAVTIAVLPAVALVANSTRAGVKLPRWLVVIGILFAILQIPGIIVWIAIGVSQL